MRVVGSPEFTKKLAALLPLPRMTASPTGRLNALLPAPCPSRVTWTSRLTAFSPSSGSPTVNWSSPPLPRIASWSPFPGRRSSTVKGPETTWTSSVLVEPTVNASAFVLPTIVIVKGNKVAEQHNGLNEIDGSGKYTSGMLEYLLYTDGVLDEAPIYEQEVREEEDELADIECEY